MLDITKIWILSGIILVVTGVLTYLCSWFFNRLVASLDKLVTRLEELVHTTTVQDVKINSLERDREVHKERLDRHSNRIQDIEKHIVSLTDKSKANHGLEQS